MMVLDLLGAVECSWDPNRVKPLIGEHETSTKPSTRMSGRLARLEPSWQQDC